MFQKLSALRKIPFVWSIICMLLCIAMLISTTYAWFTDSVTSGANRIQSGTLKVGLSYKSKTFSQHSADWGEWKDAANSGDILNKDARYEPGYTSLTFFKVENKGDLSFKYQLALLKKSETESINVNGQKFKVSDYLTFNFLVLTEQTAIKKSDVLSNNTSVFTRDNAMLLNTPAPPRGFALQHTVDAVMDTNDGCDIVALVITMPDGVGTEAMYDASKSAAPELTLDFRLVATQYTKETDSFDEYYDEKALYQPDWTAFQYIKGSLTGSGLRCYNDNGEAVVTVMCQSASGSYTLVVSECSMPIGMTAVAGETYRSYNIALLNEEGNIVSGDVSYTVQMYVGKKLTDVQLYHNGQPASPENGVTYDTSTGYNSATGYVTFMTKKFSIFTAAGNNAAVSVGGQVYPTMAEAFEAVHNGTEKTATIKLLAQKEAVTQTIAVRAGENITLDLNGCCLTSSIEKMIKNEGVLAIIDSSPNGSGVVSTGAVMNLHFDQAQRLTQALITNGTSQNAGHLSIKNVKIGVGMSVLSGQGYDYAAVENINGQMELIDCTLKADLARNESHGWSTVFAAVNCRAGVTKIIGSNVKASADYSMIDAVRATGNAQLEVTGSSLTAVHDANNNNSNVNGLHLTEQARATVKQSNITADSSTGQNCGVYLYNYTGEAELRDVNVYAAPSSNPSKALYANGASTGKVNLYGGSYTASTNVLSVDNGTLLVDGSHLILHNGLIGISLGSASTVETTSAVVRNCTIDAEGRAGSSLYAIRNRAGSFSISNSVINARNDNGYACGIYNGDYSVQNAIINKIENVSFNVNAKEVGYGIYNDQSNKTLSVKNVTIDLTENTRAATAINNKNNAADSMVLSTGNTITVRGPGSIQILAGEYTLPEGSAVPPTGKKILTWSN